MSTHRLLKRQIRKQLGDDAALPSAIAPLLEAISSMYGHNDAERKLLQRAMDISSEELLEANEMLTQVSAKQALVLGKLKDSIRALKIGDFDHDLSDEDVLSLADILDEQIALRNRAEELLRKSEEGLRLILESAKDYAIYTLDQEGRITSWNAGAARIKGYPADEVIGKHFSSFYTPEDLTLGLAQQTFDEAVYAGRSETQGWRVRKDGTLFWADVTMTAMRDDGGVLQGFVKITRDITDRKQAEETLKRAKEAAEAANRAKSLFVAHMSHEIRTPMNAIIGMTTLLLDPPLHPEQHECVETIRASGEALLSIINDILDFSKIEAGKLSLDVQPFDLCGCIEETLDLFASKAAKKGVELAYFIDAHTPNLIAGDVARLRQVLVNLIGNAVKFTKAGEVVVTVRSQRQGEGYRHRFAVRDTGIGIPQDRMNRLFKPFSQVDSSSTRRYGGTGLGLAISKRLAEIMGGTIWVKSEVGAGTTFFFTIMTEAIAQPVAAQGWPGKRILIVEDKAISRDMLTHCATSLGLRPMAVDTGPKALEMLAEDQDFDLAILDAQMPGMNGLALATELRASATHKALPLILLNARGEMGLQDQASSLQIAAFLTKPIRQHLFYQALESIFEPQATPPSEPSPAIPLFDDTLAERHPLRILLAEDNLVNQKVALRLLDRLGYRVDAVANGVEVIEALERQPYDVVLMDVQMPEMDGLEATRHIRNAFPQDRQPYIVAVTANAMREDWGACLKVGMNDYLIKPVRIADLTTSLARIPGRNGQG